MNNNHIKKTSELYDHRKKGCLFCKTDKTNFIAENKFAYAIHDGFPATKFHTLILPKRHVVSYFDLDKTELNAINSLLETQKNVILKQDKTVSGFNIGINIGEDAGQTVFHCHVHLIPRRKGDVEDPFGGVRHTIPGKGNYKKL